MLKCPICNSENGHVLESRTGKNNTAQRRRECFNCGFRFTTIEMTVDEYRRAVVGLKMVDKITKEGKNK